MKKKTGRERVECVSDGFLKFYLLLMTFLYVPAGILMVWSLAVVSLCADLAISLLIDIHEDSKPVVWTEGRKTKWYESLAKISDVLSWWVVGCYVFVVCLLPTAMKSKSPIVMSFVFIAFL